MKNVFKYAQRGLKEFGYTGAIDGIIGRKSETALNRVHFIANTGWDRERKAIAFAQFLLNEAGAQLVVDGLFGKKTKKAFETHGPGGETLPNLSVSKGFMPDILHEPRHNHASRPTLRATGIVLHRSAGHFGTGDRAVGKFGHPEGPRRKGASLGFHFLIGKKDGEVVQFCSILKHVAHVRRFAANYVGIEFSGDVGQFRDGLIHSEPLTPWQLETGTKVIKWICRQLDIPKTEIQHQPQMFQQTTPFRGLVGHRDLAGNTHADSPRREDWAEIMRRI